MTRAEDEVERIQRQMELARTEFQAHVQQFFQTAGQLCRWQTFWSRYPWAVTSLALLIGYGLVPRRVHRITIEDAGRVRLLAYQHRLLVAKARPAAMPTGIIELLGTAIAGIIARRSLRVAKQRLTQLIPRYRGRFSSEGDR